MRVGILTSGGDCQSLNATMRALVLSLYEQFGQELSIYGILDGYYGLIHEKYQEMEVKDFEGILRLGGTILGTSRQPFKNMRKIGEDGINKVEAMKKTYKKMKLDCLVVLGGNGSMKTANLLSQEGLSVIGLPKTIDNDLWGSQVTFGFHSALEVVTRELDCIYTTATSHSRIMLVELMGHKVGWLALYGGIAGGADVILIPEIPYDFDQVKEAIKKKIALGKKQILLAVAEGAISKEDAELSKEERKSRMQNKPVEVLAKKLEEHFQREVRVTVPGHVQRGGMPNGYDRVLASRFGAMAGKMIKEKEYGNLVGIDKGQIKKIPLSEVAGKLKLVDPKDDVVTQAKLMGISFGD